MNTLPVSMRDSSVKTVAVTDWQWGDGGKGKIVVVIAPWADIIVRGSGGDNTGNTAEVEGKKFVSHLIPCGIAYDGDGKINIIGNGVAFNPRVFLTEINALAAIGIGCRRLHVAHNAKLVLPQHLLMDRLSEVLRGGGRIGTTGRGIGPCYVDHYARRGLTVNDVLNIDVFARKFKENLTEKLPFIRHCDEALVRSVMGQDELAEFWKEGAVIDADAVINCYRDYAKTLRLFVRDTDAMLRKMVGKSRILLAGSQGEMLDVDRGTYPFLTAAQCSLGGLARGAGLSERAVDRSYGVVKAFVQSRVGGGPFPTEFGGSDSERWCNAADTNETVEAVRFSNVSVNSPDEFERGVAYRRLGGEYGATTGRPRRMGRTDLPLLRYVRSMNSGEVVFTKLDTQDEAHEIEICTHYIYEGPDYTIGQRVLRKGVAIEVMIPDSEVLRHCRAVYKTFPGWEKPTRGIRRYSDLPKKLRTVIKFAADVANLTPRMISNGSDREETIIVE